MVFDPSEFHVLAQKLISDSSYDQSSRLRTAISRAYYSAFLISKEKLESLRGKPYTKVENETIHKTVIEGLAKYNSDWKYLLFNYRNKRNEADYDLSAYFTEQTAKEFAQKCIDFIAYIQ